MPRRRESAAAAFGASAPALVAVMVLVGFSPFALIGLRLLQRRHLVEA